MTNNQLNRERLEKIKSWREIYGAGSNVILPAEEAEELASMALAAMDSEPVFFIDVEGDDWINAGRIPGNKFDFNNLPDGINNLYATPQPAPELTAIVERLNLSGYEHDEDEVTPQNAAAVVDVLLQQLDDAVQGRNAQPAPIMPGVPDGYVMVPMRLTAENGAKGALSGEFSETKFINCPECFGDDECETCVGSGRIEITVPISWTTIKAIWVKGIEHFTATPQENN